MKEEIEKKKMLSVDLQLSEQKCEFICESKLRFLPIVETVVLCGHQGIVLRGSKDTGRISADEEPETNDGNFRALLRYRAKTDQNLRNHLENAAKNAMCISNRIQNEIIIICHNMIQQQIVDKVNQSKDFSILADETADIGGKEQLLICVRYLDIDNGTNKFQIREDFLSFVPVNDLTGKGLSDVIFNFLESSGLDCTYLVGQGYNGARAMSGELHGLRAYIHEKYSMALYSHCAVLLSIVSI